MEQAIHCPIHKVPMRQNWKKEDVNHVGDSWYSHKQEDGTWCNGKVKKDPQSPQITQTLQSTALAQLQASNARIEGNLKVIMQMLASIGGRTNPEPSKSDKPLPF